MENNLNQRKKYIEFIVEKYYSRFSFLHDKPLEEYQQKAVEKYLNSSLSIEEIIKDINSFVEKKRKDLENIKHEEKKIQDEDIEILDEEIIEEEEKTEVNEDKSNTELSMMMEDNKENIQEDNITISNEKPKVLVKQDTSKPENKGFAALLTVIIAILIVVAMVLVTMISYTLVK